MKNTTHGLSKHRFYPRWRDMMNRCYSPNNKHYRDYGGRGVVVCKEWRQPAAFLAWCEEESPAAGLSLDRHPDPNGPYCASNCRFATPGQQNRNMRSNVWVEHNGTLLIFKDFIELYGAVSYDVAKRRVRLHGFGLIEAGLTPSHGRPRCERSR